MQLLTRGRRMLGRRLAWRLLAVFVAAALIPLALSDWFATAAIGDIALRLNHERRAAATRNVSRQVFDRLMLAKSLLEAITNSASTSAPTAAAVPAFAALDCRPRTAGATRAPPRPVRLGLRAHAGSEPQIVMVANSPAGTTCSATLDNDHLWEPVRNASNEGTWAVSDESGHRLLDTAGAGAAGAGAGAALHAAGRHDRFAAHLFLGGEFDAGNWTFEHVAAMPRVAWHGVSLLTWLATVAAATLLGIGLIGHWTIRRALAPLGQLTEGSRRLAAGIAPTRVDIRRDDELGELATSFNDMAAQLEARFAALRGMASIDAGILGRAPFAELARQVAQRLAHVHPGARTAVAWRHRDGRFRIVRDGAPGDVDAFALAPAAVDRYETIADGRHARRDVELLAPALAAPAPAGSPLQVLGVRDGPRNQVLISLAFAAGDAAVDLQQCTDLRDRLAVAVVARNREDELVHRAAHDELTGLRNTYGLQQALAGLSAGEAQLAVLFVDLDHFKDVNDCYGHAVGDRLLQAAAKRLQRMVPAGAIVSRNGGDEFVIALPGADATAACALAARVVAELGTPFILSTTEHPCGASVGVALAPQHGTDREELLRCADIALYESKNAGRGRYTLFAPVFDAILRERSDLLAGLNKAIERSEFVVHYQPRLNVASGAITSAEALVRWQHPERGLTLPGVFIALAESSGLVDALGQFVMDAAIAQMGRWRRAGLQIERLSVNVSQRQFANATLVANVRRALERHQVAGCHLEIEVTESLLSGDIDLVKAQLDELRALGITIAMDDFGTGYSSMALLRKLPIDVMKIDRAFVRDLETDPNAVAIARTIVTLARALGLKIVAEGIETPAQAELLGEMGCDEFQGFLFSRAVAPEAFAALAGIGRSAMSVRS